MRSAPRLCQAGASPAPMPLISVTIPRNKPKARDIVIEAPVRVNGATTASAVEKEFVQVVLYFVAPSRCYT